MDANSIINVLIGAAGIAGGYFGGVRLGSGQAVSTAVEVVGLLQTQVDTLEGELNKRDAELADLKARVGILEEMVTQRAEVEAVKTEVKGVRSVVDRIAVRVGA
jgi:hypothetical protein